MTSVDVLVMMQLLPVTTLLLSLLGPGLMVITVLWAGVHWSPLELRQRERGREVNRGNEGESQSRHQTPETGVRQGQVRSHRDPPSETGNRLGQMSTRVMFTHQSGSDLPQEIF